MTMNAKESQAEFTTFSGCLLQLLWSMVGPGMVFISGLWAILEQARIGSPQDLFLVGSVVVSVGARLLDRPKVAAAGTPPAGLPNPFKYAGLIVGGAALLFMLAHLVAPLVF